MTHTNESVDIREHTLGSYLTMLRAGGSKTAAARAAGISLPFYRDIEEGNRPGAAPEKLAKLADYYGVPVTNLLQLVAQQRTAALRAKLAEAEERAS